MGLLVGKCVLSAMPHYHTFPLYLAPNSVGLCFALSPGGGRGITFHVSAAAYRSGWSW